MAIIKCPECGKEISDSAKNCIYCGYPINRPKFEIKKLLEDIKMKIPVKKMVIISGFSAFAIACIVIVFINSSLNDNDKIAIKRVENKITSIGEVNIYSSSHITEAEKLYDALSKKCQRHVENHKELTEARKTFDSLKASETIKLIDQIETVSLSNQDTIDKAKKSYDKLTANQKKLVDNSEDLLEAVDKLADLQIEDVNSKISAIGSVSLDSENAIREAKEAYDNLSDTDKKRVIGYEKLASAESDFNELAIKNCITMIDNIGQVTLNSKTAIDKVQKIYDSLSQDSKDKVTNYDTLTKATNTYKKLEKEEEDRKKVLNPGDTFSNSKWAVTYKKTNISAKILPNNPNSYYLYYCASDNETFIDLVFQIQNINTDILGINDLVGDCEVEYNGATLTKYYSLYTSNGSTIDAVYNWDGLDALDSTTLHVAIVMPRELQTNGKSVKVKLNIADQEKIICVR